MSRHLAVVIAALLVFAVACGGEDGDTTTPGTDDAVGGAIVLEFEGGELVGGVRRESVDIGTPVTMIVDGAIGDQVHVHGYDLYIEPDGPGTLEFDALIPGRFEVELEQSGQLLIELTVS